MSDTNTRLAEIEVKVNKLILDQEANQSVFEARMKKLEEQSSQSPQTTETVGLFTKARQKTTAQWERIHDKWKSTSAWKKAAVAAGLVGLGGLAYKQRDQIKEYMPSSFSSFSPSSPSLPMSPSSTPSRRRTSPRRSRT